MKNTILIVSCSLAAILACADFDLESRRFRCAGQPEICDVGMTCGADGYCAPIGSVGDAAKEICMNGLDDDGDGRVDCADTECPGTTTCGQGCYCIGGQPHESGCTDGLDNDKDATIDCRDFDCGPCTGASTCCPDGACRTSC